MKFLKKYNIELNDETYLKEALTHSSYVNEHRKFTSYERLEFLGDAILQAVTSDYFYKFTDLKEGDMTKKRASFVCENALAFYAEKIEIIHYAMVGHGQRNNVNKTILADMFEAVIAAIYLDQGYEIAKQFIYDVVIPEIEEENTFFNDYKTKLQEYVQTSKKSVDYNVVEEKGSAHDRTFVVEVVVEGIVYGVGEGKNKKAAEQEAAKNAYDKSVK